MQREEKFPQILRTLEVLENPCHLNAALLDGRQLTLFSFRAGLLVQRGGAATVVKHDDLVHTVYAGRSGNLSRHIGTQFL